MSVADTTTVVENLKEQERNQKRESANKEMLYGVLWAGGGVALTAITNGAYIFYGAVLWGAWLFLKGVFHKF